MAPRARRACRSGLMLAAVAGIAAMLSACGGMQPSPPAAVQTVELDGKNYRVEQLTASTWTAAPAAMAAGATNAAVLVKAIEKASHCRVTDSNPGEQPRVLYAQVECSSRLKN